jgi:hypothetical protein
LIEYFGVIIKLHFIKQLHVYMILDVQYMCITFSRMVDVPYLYSPHFFTKKVLPVVHVHVYTQLVYFYYNMYL